MGDGGMTRIPEVTVNIGIVGSESNVMVDGKPIRVTELDLHVGARDITTAILRCDSIVGVAAVGKYTVAFKCPVCEQDVDHDCGEEPKSLKGRIRKLHPPVPYWKPSIPYKDQKDSNI